MGMPTSKMSHLAMSSFRATSSKSFFMLLAAVVPRSVDLGLLIFDLFEVGGSSSILFPKLLGIKLLR